MIRRLLTTGPPIFFVVFLQLLYPLSSILKLWFRPPTEWLSWLPLCAATGSYVVLFFFIGAWAWLGWVVRWSLPVLFLTAAFSSYPCIRSEVEPSSLVAAEPILSLSITTLFLAATILALLGRRAGDHALALDFPLRGGTYIVGQGGSSWLVNYHRVNASQQYAIDLLKLNAAGVRARGLYPANPAAYAIFGAEVVAPCDAVVVAAEDGFEDLSPPDRQPQHPAGNHIALEGQGTIVYLAHLMKNSLRVKVGDPVKTGEILGRVGNSGNTTEPHLHIHAEEGPYRGVFSGGKARPILFNGRFLVRNDRVRKD